MNQECNGTLEVRQKHSLDYLRQLRKEQAASKNQICEEDTQRNRDYFGLSLLRKIYQKCLVAPAVSKNWIMRLRPMTVMRSSVNIAASLTQCLFLTLIMFPCLVFREVLYTAIGITLGNGYYKPETENPGLVMMNLIHFHWFTISIKVANLYFGMKASLLSAICP